MLVVKGKQRAVEFVILLSTDTEFQGGQMQIPVIIPAPFYHGIEGYCVFGSSFEIEERSVSFRITFILTPWSHHVIVALYCRQVVSDIGCNPYGSAGRMPSYRQL